MGIDQISFDLLDDLERITNHSACMGLTIRMKNAPITQPMIAPNTGISAVNAVRDADEQGVGETENRQRDEKSAPRIQASRH